LPCVIQCLSVIVIVIIFQRFPLAVFFFHRYLHQLAALCHAQGDIFIDPYTSISYRRTSPPSRKNILKTTDSSLISDLQLILIIDVLREDVILFFF